jgi:hypothetical protein
MTRATNKPSKSFRDSARRRVFDYIRKHPDATDRHVQRGLDMNPNTQRPRRVELERAGLVTTVGMRRTPAGAFAHGWMATGESYPAIWTNEDSVRDTRSGLAFVRRALLRVLPFPTRTPKMARLIAQLEKAVVEGGDVHRILGLRPDERAP